MVALSPDEARRRVGSGCWIDVRPEPEFRLGHVPGAGNVPLSEWDARRAELPPPGVDVIVVADDAETAARAARRLAERHAGSVDHLAAPWPELGAPISTDRPARLWRPAPLLEEAIDSIPRGLALDVACGAGREAVFLALAGFEVEAWDHDAEALERAGRLARHHGVAITTRLVDLEAGDPGIPIGRYHLVTCFRFLHRPLLPRLERGLAPGGWLVYETYRVGQERLGRPKRERFLLQPGELPRAFAGLEIVRAEEPDPPGGPLTSRLVARKPLA